jgi:hypothetical protein
MIVVIGMLMEVVEAMMDVGGARIDGSGSLRVKSADVERTARARTAATQPAGRREDVGAPASSDRSCSDERAVAARLTCAEFTVVRASDPDRIGVAPTIISLMIQETRRRPFGSRNGGVAPWRAGPAFA